ncbi:MAG TPA: TetR family transcriptional regulator, partial [Phenylobacterium sp.]|nr:TetR family transcriptional regulator [Phenylobacterium sp.]
MPRIVDAAARRDAFVEVAADLIAAEGLEGASLRRVAAAAGCTTGAVTHYFGSREVLLAAVLRQAHDAAQARMEAAAMQVPDPMTRLRTV